VKFKVWRNGSERELSAKLEELDQKTLASAQPDSGPGSDGAESVLTGVRVDNVSPDYIRRFRLLENSRGVVVVAVDPDSNASSDLRPGDIIEEVSRQPVTNVNEFNAAVSKLGKKSVLLRVRNQAGVRFVVIKAED
jgi:serine protease Do